MIGIENLPHEILMSVADHLVDRTTPDSGYDSWTGDLYCSSLVSRNFRNAAEALLYSSFQKHGTNVTLFVRTLVEQPQLAPLVRKVVIGIDGSGGRRKILPPEARVGMRTTFGSTKLYHAAEVSCLG
jgi:hypothetical protein